MREGGVLQQPFIGAEFGETDIRQMRHDAAVDPSVLNYKGVAIRRMQRDHVKQLGIICQGEFLGYGGGGGLGLLAQKVIAI